uniref:Uncharacterized protein n=1 Tax=Minutocellus polymorphus TaxID=265543 RepID=A0A7S0FLZ2_9STRA
MLPASWSDGVYMESQFSDKKYVAINSRVPVTDSHGEEAPAGEVLFFDVDEEKVASRVLVGPRPVHSYGVYTHNEYWTHSDGDGYFYIIDLKSIDRHNSKPIQVHQDTPSHGKLMWDEDGALQGTGYATSTGEPFLFIFDMDTHEEIGKFDFSEWCNASHSIGFSSVNKHLYIECSRGAPTLLELDVSTPRNPQYVEAHAGITGSIYETPDASAIAVTDKGGSKFHLIEPGATGEAASSIYTVDVYGHPSTPVFFPNGRTDGKTNFNTCLSLTINTNQRHYHKNKLMCSYYGCSQAATQNDVDAGMCLYALDANGEQTNSLLSVGLTDISDIAQGTHPNSKVCQRCASELNYNDEDGKCVCTPNCGSCASDTPEDHNADLSGAVCMDMSTMTPSRVSNRALRSLKDITPSSHPDSTFVAAGSVKQGSPYSYSAQCGFGRTYRSHKKGGKYTALPSNFPTNSVSIINVEDFSLKCTVELDGTPGRVIYVPPTGSDSSMTASGSTAPSGGGLSGGAIAGIVIGSLVVVLASAILIINKSKNGKDEKYTESAEGGVN